MGSYGEACIIELAEENIEPTSVRFRANISAFFFVVEGTQIGSSVLTFTSLNPP